MLIFFPIFATFPRAFQVPNAEESLHNCTILANRLDFAISEAVQAIQVRKATT